MRKNILGQLGLAAAAGLLALNASAGQTHWGYSGQEGPDHWSGLDASFSTCGAGKNQSPVDLTERLQAQLPPLVMQYRTGGQKILNNGHTVQVQYAPGSSVTLDGRAFELKQFHFHAPSENTIDGKSFPLEAHLVHADKDGNLAVVAVLFEQGPTNEALRATWDGLPQHEGDAHPVKGQVNAADLLPADHAYYRYDGSLTTPPCTEGVRWIVMKAPVEASQQQIEAMSRAIGHPNNRPVQPLNARIVVQ